MASMTVKMSMARSIVRLSAPFYEINCAPFFKKYLCGSYVTDSTATNTALHQRPETPQLIWRLSRMMFEKAKHNTRAGLDAKEELLEALDIAKKVC